LLAESRFHDGADGLATDATTAPSAKKSSADYSMKNIGYSENWACGAAWAPGTFWEASLVCMALNLLNIAIHLINLLHLEFQICNEWEIYLTMSCKIFAFVYIQYIFFTSQYANCMTEAPVMYMYTYAQIIMEWAITLSFICNGARRFYIEDYEKEITRQINPHFHEKYDLDKNNDGNIDAYEVAEAKANMADMTWNSEDSASNDSHSWVEHKKDDEGKTVDELKKSSKKEKDGIKEPLLGLLDESAILPQMFPEKRNALLAGPVNNAVVVQQAPQVITQPVV
jgi:hypothetical protein